MYIVLHAYISRYISLQEDVTKVEVHADDGIIFQLLSGKDDFVGENKFDMSLLQATGGTGGSVQQQDKGSSKLNKVVTHEYTYTHMYMYKHIYTHPHTYVQVVQLTGFSDPVYAEAYVNVNQYDIVFDVLVVNQTSDTLQGLSLELATLGMYIM